MGRFVIVAYTPKAGQEQALLAAVKKHLQVLQAEQLVTDRPAYVMRAGDGTIVEIFEWRSAEAIQQAHASPAVQALWAELGAACEYIPLTKLAEAHIPLVANVTARPIRSAGDIRDELNAQLTSPVAWTDSIRFLGTQGVDRYVETGPGDVLLGLVKRIDREAQRARFEI